MQNDERNKLIDLINQGANGHTFMPTNLIADHLIANDIIVPPCKIGETLYLIQVDFKGNCNLSSCKVNSKITMLSILRAYAEKTILCMSTDKDEVEEKLKEFKKENSDGK